MSRGELMSKMKSWFGKSTDAPVRSWFALFLCLFPLLFSVLWFKPTPSVPVPAIAAHAYRPASRDRKLIFPRDHGAHRDSAYEWWYFTGHLLDRAGKEQAGFELTVFRLSPSAGPMRESKAGLRPESASYLMAHFAVSDLKTGQFFYRSFGMRERTASPEVHAADETLQVEMPGVQMAWQEKSRQMQLFADVGGRVLRASLRPTKPLVLHGERGFSKKGACETCASHYSSFTRLEGQGDLTGLSHGRMRVWYDHEFGSNALEKGQTGWDWLSIQFDDGWDLMLFRLRSEQGPPVFHGSLISPQGEVSPLSAREFSLKPEGSWASPHTGASYPAEWKVEVSFPEKDFKRSFRVVPKLADQELRGELATYWEGTCDVQDASGRSLGLSYLEMTGYDSRSRPRF